MIDFELSDSIANMKNMVHLLAENMMRPAARKYDEEEHGDKPLDFINMMWEDSKRRNRARFEAGTKQKQEGKPEKPAENSITFANVIEELSWGDCGLYLCMPGGLGVSAVEAVGTPDQKERFLRRFTEGDPKWGAMAITEANAGSDTAAITATAARDGDHWVLNGEKIFVTSGKSAVQDSKGFVVVWATLDRSAGRAGIKSFIVEHGTPGMTVTKVEKKLGIRASDTCTIVFEDCRIPLDNILGSPDVQKKDSTSGFKGVMATFDATRPMVAASAIGIGRAAIDFVKDEFEKRGVQIRYGISPYRMTAVEREVQQMEANLQAARLLTWRACWMMDRRMRNSLEASMAKAKAGLAVTLVTQKAVELMGPLGYSRDLLLEKWMRDGKINDLFEGTGQINMLIVARRILEYTREQLK
ncbi:MAG: acyl-CoA dehydrogenase family protein [Candidatus Lindowbacteria bacterium]|nr:acyl-CoA dehydrogenase family protein [Candidatus Lindowbacteria bacterium]